MQTLLKQLNKFLKPDQILDSAIDFKLYDTDATSMFKKEPCQVLLPNTSEEVRLIVQAINDVNKSLANCDRFNFVARGAGTGLSGGAIASKNSIIISLARLTKLLNFDPINRTALIETGIVNAHLSEKIKSSGLHFSPDPSSQDACTVGGNIAENAGGIHCYKHGVTSEQILGLEIVMPDGSIKYLGELGENLKQRTAAHKMDLVKFFVGSEGTFGIATKALVKVQPIPEAFLTFQACFETVNEAAQVVKSIIKEGLKPTAIEMIDHGAIEAVNSAFELGLEESVQAILLIELDGANDEVLLEAKAIKKILEKFKCLKIQETQDPEERMFFWKVRKGTVAAFGKIAPFWYLYDAVVPRSKIPEALDAIEKISEKYKLKLASVLHAADGNLHPNFLYDPDKDPDVIHRIHQASSEIMKLCINMGGVLSGEHGIGVEKQDYMPYMFSEIDLELMKSVRKIFDPQLISNPNKIFPLRICKEF